MEQLVAILYLPALLGLWVTWRNWLRSRRLARENRRRTLDAIRENGRLEDRPIMRIRRLERG
jgi:hypothetical protein